ncbi:MAG: cysteine hydrolase [Bacteroidota bacterium]
MKNLIMIFMTLIFGGCSTHSSKIIQTIPEIKRENTAIVVIEFQKTWTEKGFFHRLIKKELNRNNITENTKQLLENARRNDITIIQAPLILDKSNKEAYRKVPFIPKFFKGFTKNTWKAEYTEGIYEESDIEISGRCGFDACEGSDLEEILQERNLKNLFFCGFTTEHCVEMTMNTLKEKGYNCILISDCTATKSKRLQSKVEKRNIVIKSNDLINEIKTVTNIKTLKPDSRAERR